MGCSASALGSTAVGKSRRAFGRAGEDLAAAWYEAQGYEVLARNWSCREGELDIVARRGCLYVFCEVKARRSEAFGLPAEAVGPLKQARLRRLAALWFAGRAAGLPPARTAERSPDASTAPAAVPSPDGSTDGAAVGAAALGGRRRGGPVRFDVACVLGVGGVEVIEAAF
jgi:putative endonuclease